MTTCQDFDVLVTLRATGDLDEDEVRRLELHLAACPRCRAEAEQDAAVVKAVRLPGPSDAERRATASLSRSTLAELHRREGRAGSVKRVAVVLAAIAALLVAVLAPALFGRRLVTPGPGAVGASGATVEASTWEPDLDTVWSDTEILDEDASFATYDASDATVASLDY